MSAAYVGQYQKMSTHNIIVCLQDFIKERNVEDMSFEEFTENQIIIENILRY